MASTDAATVDTDVLTDEEAIEALATSETLVERVSSIEVSAKDAGLVHLRFSGTLRGSLLLGPETARAVAAELERVADEIDTAANE